MMIKMTIGDKKSNLKLKKFLVLIIISICFIRCANSDKREVTLINKENNVLRFEGRGIDVVSYFEQFPFSQFSVSKDGSKMLFLKKGEEDRLQYLNIGRDGDFSQSKDVIDLDFATRNAWSPHYNKKDDAVYWIGDEQNDEIINIYRTAIGSDTVEKLTDVSYIYAWGINPAETKIAYVARLGESEESISQLRILNLETLEDNLIMQDNSALQFTWSDVSWRPNEEGVALLMVKGQDRTFTNVVYVDFEKKSIKILSDEDEPSSSSGSGALNDWINDDICLFLSDDNGFSNLYQYSFDDNKTKKLTDFTLDIESAHVVNLNNLKYILALQKSPIETKSILIDPSTAKVLWTKDSDLNLSFGTSIGEKILILAEGTETVFELQEETLSLNGYDTRIVLNVSKDDKDKLIQSNVERIEIPSFDVDSKTSDQRLLHAYLYKPLNPLPKGREIVMIESFYGGSNGYNPEYQILAQAGIYVLSPSPRGSSGFGRDFAAMNDKDLGGNEILDIIYSAKYISEKLNIPPERIGVFGMSHGGYGTMRLMTFPGKINDHSASFSFGFGIETAGFADIIFQHETSNIPGWTFLEAGDPKKDSLKLMDRSPITHAEKITGPLLLFHGDHDNRVRVEGSRMMKEKLDELGKENVYVEFPGLGHGIKGIKNKAKYYSETFKFIEDYVLK